MGLGKLYTKRIIQICGVELSTGISRVKKGGSLKDPCN